MALNPRINTARALLLMLTLGVAVPLGLLGAAGTDEGAEAPRTIAIITDVDNPVTSVSRSELSRIFLKKQTAWTGGARCIPIDQRGESEIRREFSRLVLQKSVHEMKRYWMQETMTGNARPPVALEGADTVKKYVRKIAGAVGYVYLDEVDDTVRVLAVTDVDALAKPDAEADEAPEPADQTDQTDQTVDPQPSSGEEGGADDPVRGTPP